MNKVSWDSGVVYCVSDTGLLIYSSKTGTQHPITVLYSDYLGNPDEDNSGYNLL